MQESQSGFESKGVYLSLNKEYRFTESEWTVYELSSSNESLSASFQFLDGMDGALKRDYDLCRGIMFRAQSASIWTTLAEDALKDPDVQICGLLGLREYAQSLEYSQSEHRAECQDVDLQFLPIYSIKIQYFSV